MADVHSNWTFLTNHAHVLLCLVKSPSLRMRDIAASVCITERAVQKIIADLRRDGYIRLRREGRRNTYTVDLEKHLKHPLEGHKQIDDLVGLIFDKVPKTHGEV